MRTRCESSTHLVRVGRISPGLGYCSQQAISQFTAALDFVFLPLVSDRLRIYSGDGTSAEISVAAPGGHLTRGDSMDGRDQGADQFLDGAAHQLGWLHLAFALVMSIVVTYDTTNQQATWWSRVRPWAMVAWMFTLYSTLGRLSIEAVGTDTFDSVLARIDGRLFGFDPSREIQRFLTPSRVEVFAVAYAWFIPYIHLALFLNLESRGGENHERFLTAWTLLYTLSYLGYLFVPAFGPTPFRSNMVTRNCKAVIF